MSEPVERIEIATVQRTGHYQVQVSLIRMQDLSWWLSMRVWFKDKATGEFRPGSGGLTFPAATITDLANALFDALREARDRAIIE